MLTILSMPFLQKSSSKFILARSYSPDISLSDANTPISACYFLAQVSQDALIKGLLIISLTVAPHFVIAAEPTYMAATPDNITTIAAGHSNQGATSHSVAVDAYGYRTETDTAALGTNIGLNSSSSISGSYLTDSAYLADSAYLENSALSTDKNTLTVQPPALKTHSMVDPVTGIHLDNIYAVHVPELLSLSQAQRVLNQVSPKIASNQAGIAANAFLAEATQDLNKPMVFLRAGASHYDIDADIDLTNAKAALNAGVNDLAMNAGANPNASLPLDPNLAAATPGFINEGIPNNYRLESSDNRIGAGVGVLWPVYTAGRTQAITSLAEARTQESQADALVDSDDLQTTLIERYFNTQLAMIVAYLREDALNTTKETDHMAQRLLEEGFISQVERLEAKTALASANYESISANHDAQLAMTALQRLLRSSEAIKPITPLFMSSTPLPALSHFQQLALEHHPILKKVDAKYNQAESIYRFSDTGLKPNVSIYGYHQIDSKPSWVAGVSATWKLWGGLNDTAQEASGQARMRSALLAKVDASDNILLLVEKNWQEVENARIRYYSLNSDVSLSQELLRYKQLGLQEGINTALDVTTAQTKALQALTTQVAAANDYVQALAALMQSCGTPEGFGEYMAQADVKLPTVY